MGDSGLTWLPRYGNFGIIGRISGFDIHVEARSGLTALDVTVFLPEVPRSGFTMPKESFLGSREGAGGSGPRTEVDAPARDTPGRASPGTPRLGL